MRRYDGFRAPWWPYEQPKCETCGQYHTMVCPIEREAAAKRVRLKRALRLAGLDPAMTMLDLLERGEQ